MPAGAFSVELPPVNSPDEPKQEALFIHDVASGWNADKMGLRVYACILALRLHRRPEKAGGSMRDRRKT